MQLGFVRTGAEFEGHEDDVKLRLSTSSAIDLGYMPMARVNSKCNMKWSVSCE